MSWARDRLAESPRAFRLTTAPPTDTNTYRGYVHRGARGVQDDRPETVARLRRSAVAYFGLKRWPVEPLALAEHIRYAMAPYALVNDRDRRRLVCPDDTAAFLAAT